MNRDKLSSLVCRLFFLLAGLSLALGGVEKLANLNQKTVVRIYSPERLLEITAAFAILVVVLLLRQIRDLLRASAR